ncbi:uncharacterized protein LOC144613783 [Panthera onca]
MTTRTNRTGKKNMAENSLQRVVVFQRGPQKTLENTERCGRIFWRWSLCSQIRIPRSRLNGLNNQEIFYQTKPFAIPSPPISLRSPAHLSGYSRPNSTNLSAH